MLLPDKSRICRYFRRHISGPSEPETPDDVRSRAITLFISLQSTPFHVQGVASAVLQLDLIELGSIRFLDRARRAWPSGLKLHDDVTKEKNSENQGQKTRLIWYLKTVS
jgi:hypothetical protein